MTRLQAVGVMLVALGLIYALLYAAWVRKGRRHASAAIAAERRRTEDTAAGKAVAPAPAVKEDRSARVVAEGTYVSTTTAASRLERVTVEGLGHRAKATLTVNRGQSDQLVRIDRRGESTVVIPAGRLVSVRRDRGMAGKFIGANRLLVLQWKTPEGDIYETGFLPRYRADVDTIESALWWHTGATDNGTKPGVTDTDVRDTGVTHPGATDTPVTDTAVTDTAVTDTRVTDTRATQSPAPEGDPTL